MGREVRMVPKDWEHPVNGRGQCIPLFSRDVLESWDHRDGPPPTCVMPEFAEGTATHLMMYEDTSEGTPISPAFATAEELARWLTDNRASFFGGQTIGYEDWMEVIRRGWSPGIVVHMPKK